MTGGLLDATTDSVYLATEDFQSWELKMAATLIMTLPIVLVALGFWAIIFVDYRAHPWRRLLLPVEGPLKLLLVVYAGTTSFGWYAASNIVKVPLAITEKILDPDDGLGPSTFFANLYKTLFKDTEKDEVGASEDGGAEFVHKRFWERGLTQLLLVRARCRHANYCSIPPFPIFFLRSPVQELNGHFSLRPRTPSRF